MGTLQSLLFLTITTLSVIYHEVFSPNLDQYFLAVGITAGLVNLLAIFFVRKARVVKNYEPIDFMEVKEDTASLLHLENVDRRNHRECKFPFWLTIDFQLIIWTYAILVAVTHVILVMCSTYVQSLNLETYLTPILFATPFITASLLLAIGFLSDISLTMCPRNEYFSDPKCCPFCSPVVLHIVPK